MTIIYLYFNYYIIMFLMVFIDRFYKLKTDYYEDVLATTDKKEEMVAMIILLHSIYHIYDVCQEGCRIKFYIRYSYNVFQNFQSI